MIWTTSAWEDLSLAFQPTPSQNYLAFQDICLFSPALRILVTLFTIDFLGGRMAQIFFVL